MQNIKVWETPKVSETDHKGEKPFSRSWERRVNHKNQITLTLPGNKYV